MKKHTLRRFILAAISILSPAAKPKSSFGSANIINNDESRNRECQVEDSEDLDEYCACGTEDGLATVLAGYEEDPNRDIFGNPDIDLHDLQDLGERYLAARLRDGDSPAPGNIPYGPQQSVEPASGMGSGSNVSLPEIRSGGRSQTVQDLIQRHFRNRDW